MCFTHCLRVVYFPDRAQPRNRSDLLEPEPQPPTDRIEGVLAHRHFLGQSQWQVRPAAKSISAARLGHFTMRLLGYHHIAENNTGTNLLVVESWAQIAPILV